MGKTFDINQDAVFSGNVYIKGALKAPVFTFDIVVRTQSEFDALIASPDWFGAVSVAFVGDGGTLRFKRANGLGVKIPQSVKQIQGINNAIIDVTKFVFNMNTNPGGLFCIGFTPSSDYNISDLCVSCTGAGGDDAGYGFANCNQLTNCIGTIPDGAGCGFWKCNQLTNCTGAVVGYGAGFDSCNRLTNCTGTVMGGGYGYDYCDLLTNCTCTVKNGGTGFKSCNRLTNCTSEVTTSEEERSSHGFHFCDKLTNCTGTVVGKNTRTNNGFYNCAQLTNCTGMATGGGYGYGYLSCSFASNCRGGTTPSTTAIWGGTNTYIDPNTCEGYN